MNLKSKFTIFSLVVGIIVLAFFAVHIWAISAIGQQYEDTQNLSGNVQNDLIKNQQLTNLKRNLKNASEQKTALLAVFIKKDDIPNFIQSLENVMKNLKIGGTTKSVSERDIPDLTSSGKDELLISFEAESTYPNLMQFVSILENVPYKSYISSASIVKEDLAQPNSSSTKSTKTNIWKLNVTLNVVKIKEIVTTQK